MSKVDQVKLLAKARKLQKELKKEVIVIESGDGAVRVEITGEQKIKKSQSGRQADRDQIHPDQDRHW